LLPSDVSLAIVPPQPSTSSSGCAAMTNIVFIIYYALLFEAYFSGVEYSPIFSRSYTCL